MASVIFLVKLTIQSDAKANNKLKKCISLYVSLFQISNNILISDKSRNDR